MLSKTIQVLRYFLLEYHFYFFSITSLSVLLIYTHNETLALEKELVRINEEFQMNQVTFEKRQKTCDEKMEQQYAEIERMIKEIH